MKFFRVALVTVAVAVCTTGLWAFQRIADFGFGNDDSPSNVKAEFYWSRLAYSSSMASYGGYGGFGGFGGRGGRFQSWSRDYPKADRQFLIAMHRLTRIDGRPTEQVVTLDDDEIFNYPWIYAVQVQTWSFTDAEAKRLREYLLKGGFLMVDDFHGTEDWENFMNGMRQVLPDRPVEDLQSNDEIFHTLYDVDDKMQIPAKYGEDRPHLREGWLSAQVARHPRRQRANHGSHLPQYASGRRLGVGRRPGIPGGLRLDGLQSGAGLHHLRNDSLVSPAHSETKSTGIKQRL